MTVDRPLRVLFACIAHPTHFQSMVPLAWALRAAGHEVRVASQGALADTITGAGLTAVPVGEDHGLERVLAAKAEGSAPTIDFGALRSGEPDFDWLLGFYTMLVPTFFAAVNNESMVDDLVTLAREWEPDLVVWEPLTWAGGVAALASGAAHARLLWGPDVLGRTREHFVRALDRLPPEHRDDPLGEWLGWTLRRHGLDFDESVTRGDWAIEQDPPSVRIAVGQHTVPMRYVPYNGPAVVPGWVRTPPARPRVCVSLGVSARNGMGTSTVSLGDLLDGLSDLDAEVVATLNAGQRAGLTSVPGNVRLVEFVPLHALLPSCSAIVHHGGAGTWGTAMRYAVPQVVVPEIWDAPLKAAMLADTGAGLVQRAGELTPGSLRAKVSRVLGEPSFAEAARRLRDEQQAQPAPAAVVGELERLTSKYRRERG
ncbi:activator-dependent family glycosyltransferase [Prauserella flavalba]|uniref:activator-dependent family glycosyltransferase n=1 Tax=Prauserella flavalba TaxID=1477506 RepID=UPI00248299B2|nr:activator-dependent family glycosyltransferase [Prauserella flavalba]